MSKCKEKPCATYDRDGICIAVGDSIHDLARQLRVSSGTVSKALHRGSKKYAWIEELEK